MFGYPTARDQNFCFVLFGPTGAGKTTLINFMAAKDLDDVQQLRGGQGGMGPDSMTKEIAVVHTPKFWLEDQQCSFTLLDTPGYGAKDQHKWVKGSLMASTVKQLLRDTSKINGVVLVLKMERFRSDMESALKDYISFFQHFDLDKTAVLVVITHSLPYNDQIKNEYRVAIAKLFEQHVIASNVIHVNVCLPGELMPEFQSLYEAATGQQLSSLKEHMRTNFKKEHNIRHWFDVKSGIETDVDKMLAPKKGWFRRS